MIVVGTDDSSQVHVASSRIQIFEYNENTRYIVSYITAPNRSKFFVLQTNFHIFCHIIRH